MCFRITSLYILMPLLTCAAASPEILSRRPLWWMRHSIAENPASGDPSRTQECSAVHIFSIQRLAQRCPKNVGLDARFAIRHNFYVHGFVPLQMFLERAS